VAKGLDSYPELDRLLVARASEAAARWDGRRSVRNKKAKAINQNRPLEADSRARLALRVNRLLADVRLSAHNRRPPDNPTLRALMQSPTPVSADDLSADWSTKLSWELATFFPSNSWRAAAAVTPLNESIATTPGGGLTMARGKITMKSNDGAKDASSAAADPFRLRRPGVAARDAKPLVHIIRKGVRCDTEKRGHETSRGRSPLEIVVDASEGFIPLWAKDTTLRWRFRDSSFEVFDDPAAAKSKVEKLLGEAILAWGDAVPVKFAKKSDAWDFEVVMRQGDDCDDNGCVLASAFFPDAGRHKVILYPKMFTQSKKEQLETLVHEIGHIFGLRHFFAQVSEGAWPSEVFGTHHKFSIMNYGDDSALTKADKSDLRKLYQLAWAGELTEINGTPIRFVKPFHMIGDAAESVVAVGQIQTVVQSPRKRRRS
jgi:hypothetical protein